MASENLALIKVEYIKGEKNLHKETIQNDNREKTKKMNNLFCENCSLQFDKKIVFDLHLSLLHREKIGVENEVKKNTCIQSEWGCKWKLEVTCWKKIETTACRKTYDKFAFEDLWKGKKVSLSK